MRTHDQLPGQLAVAQNLDPVRAAIREAFFLQTFCVHAFAVLERGIQRAEVHRQIRRAMTRVVEPALRNAADERHLAAFESDADRAAGTRGLAFATASAGLAVSAAFALAEPLATVPGARSRFE